LSSPEWIRRAQGDSRLGAETKYNWEKEAPLLIELVGAAVARNP